MKQSTSIYTNIIHAKISDEQLKDIENLSRKLNINTSTIIRMALSQLLMDYKHKKII